MDIKYGQKEKIAHGDSLFPINVYHLDLGYASHLMECHWHEETELIYMKRGKAFFQIDTENVEVCSGQAIFVNGSSLHSGVAYENTYCEFYAVVFDLNMLSSSTVGLSQNKFLTPLINNQLSLPLKISDNANLQEYIEKQVLEIIETFQNKLPGYELCVKGSLYKILSVLIGNNLIINGTGRENSTDWYRIERIKTVLNYINSNYNSRISEKVIADEVKMSKSYFCRFFKQMTGQTLIEYVNYFRVNKASELLLEGNRKIIDVAFESGFDNVSYFIKVFKRVKGCTPSEFRRL